MIYKRKNISSIPWFLSLQLYWKLDVVCPTNRSSPGLSLAGGSRVFDEAVSTYHPILDGQTVQRHT